MPATSYRAVFLGLAVLVNLLLVLAYLFRPALDIRFSPNSISFPDGQLYTFPVGNPGYFPYDFSGDNDRGEGEQSKLELFEDGKPLGPAHHPHLEIGKLGGGRFSHWEETIFFSSSDGTDPRTNGYRYSARNHARIKPGLWAAALAWLTAAALLYSGPWLMAVCAAAASNATQALVQGFSLSPRGRRYLLLAALAFNALVLAAHASRPTVEFTLSPDMITAERGNAFAFPVPKLIGFPYELVGDSVGVNSLSPLMLYENGKPLGPAHAVHDEIRGKGLGRFSHWNNAIILSSSDGTDPRTNGYYYSAKNQARLSPGLWVAALAWLTAAALLYAGPWLMAVCAIAASMLTRALGQGFSLSQRGRPNLPELASLLKAGFSLSPRGKRYLLLAALALNALLLVAHVSRPTVEFTLSPDKITAERGNAYTFPAPKLIGFPYELVGDSVGGSSLSPLVLYENGKPLGPAHAVHDEIRAKGQGRFSHWEQVIIFSSSDNRSPNTNGNTYTALGKVRLKAILWVPSVILLVIATLMVSNQRVFDFAAFALLPNPRLARRPVYSFLFLITAVGLACACVAHKWQTGESLSLGIAGFLPVSDAHGYWQCATWIDGDGASRFAENSFMRDWCSRRLIYPSFLSGILRLTGWYLPAALLVQASLIAVAIAALGLVATARLGLVAAGLVAYLLFDFTNVHAFGVLMTEVSGFTAGTAAAVLLIKAIDSGRTTWLFSGLALFSIAMVSRAGAMFVLPLLGAWSLWLLWRLQSRLSLAMIIGCFASLAAGIALQISLTHAVGVNTAASFGNFATTLYRLSAGKDSWSSAYSDHPELFQNLSESEAFKALYKIALENIKTHPETLITGYFREGGRYLGPLLNFDHQGGLPSIFLVLVLLGTWQCLRNWRSPFHLLLLCVLVGEITSTPLLYGDGGARVFAATIAFRALMAGLGSVALWEIASTLAARFRLARTKAAPLSIGQFKAPAILGAFSGAMVPLACLLPFTGILAYSELRPLPALSCEPPYRPAVFRVDRESIVFTIAEGASETEAIPFRIPEKHLKEGLLRHGFPWFAESFLSLAAGSMVIQGVNLAANEFSFMQLMDLVWRGPRPPAGATVSVCVDAGKSTELAGTGYMEIVKLQTTSDPVSTTGELVDNLHLLHMLKTVTQ